MSETWESGATEAVVSPVPRLDVRNRDGSAEREHQLQEEVLDLIEGAFCDRAAAAEHLLQYNGNLATVYILMRKATEEDKETVEKALTPNLKLAERIMAWEDYSLLRGRKGGNGTDRHANLEQRPCCGRNDSRLHHTRSKGKLCRFTPPSLCCTYYHNF